MSEHEATNHMEGEGKRMMERNAVKLKKIQEAGGFEAYALQNPREIQEALIPKGRATQIGCSDERVPVTGRKSPGPVVFDLFVLGAKPAALARRYKELGITVVTTHAGCGAARMAAEKAGAVSPLADSATQSKQAEEFAIEKTKEFCKDFWFTYRHIEGHELTPQGHVHPGPSIYLNYAENGFDPNGIVQGYVVDANVIDKKKDQATALKALLGIAFTKGNAGDYLQNEGRRLVRVQETEKPLKFTLVIIEKTPELLKKKVSEWSSKKFGFDIDVQGFVAPTV